MDTWTITNLGDVLAQVFGDELVPLEQVVPGVAPGCWQSRQGQMFVSIATWAQDRNSGLAGEVYVDACIARAVPATDALFRQLNTWNANGAARVYWDEEVQDVWASSMIAPRGYTREALVQTLEDVLTRYDELARQAREQFAGINAAKN